MHRLLTGLFILVGLTFAAPCLADEPLVRLIRPLAGAESLWAQRPLTIEMKLSLWGSPSGLVAVGASYALLPWLSVGVGVGAGFQGEKTDAVPQFDAMMRLRMVSLGLTNGNIALYAGAGGSEGFYTTSTLDQLDEDAPPTREWDHAWWGNLELGLDRQWNSGLSLRLYAGNGWNLSRSSGRCTERSMQVALSVCGDRGTTFAYAGMAVGYAFSP